jgi:hypothetical protein
MARRALPHRTPALRSTHKEYPRWLPSASA